jgi:hypothetical protein
MRAPICVFALLACSASRAQCERLDSVSNALQTIWDGRWEQETYDQGDPFYHDFLKLLSDPATFECSLDSDAFIFDTWSADKQLRVLTWDHLSTGSYHDMVSIAQYRTSGAEIGVEAICGGGDVTDSIDIRVQTVHALPNASGKMYLLIGWGTRGGGSHHSTALVYRSDGNDLKRCSECLPNNGIYEMETSRSNEIRMLYDPVSMTLRHNGFISTEEEEPWNSPTGKQVRLIWNGGSFIPSPE